MVLGRNVRNLAMGLTVAGLFLLLLNLLAAGWEWFQYGTLRRDGRPVGLYVEEVRNGRRRLHLRPGARLHGVLYKVDINTLGFRGSELAVPKPPGTFRVWCVGGSTTFDIYASSNEATWPARLEALLSARSKRVRVEVVNAGIPGENLDGSLEDFERFYPTVRPDVLVVYHGPNDIQRGLDEVFGFPHAPDSVPPLPDFALIRFLSREVADPAELERMNREVNEDVLDLVERRIVRLLDAAEARGVRVVMATHAFRAEKGARGEVARKQVGRCAAIYMMVPDRVVEGIDRLNDLIVRLAARRGLPVADVRAAVPPEDRYWGDALHFSDAGSELAARAIADTFARAGLVPP